jgi:hypothetical protein
MLTALSNSGYVAAMTLPIIAPELPPVRYTLPASTPYFSMAYEIMLAIAWLSPPPLWLSDCRDETSQQVPECGDDGHSVMYPLRSDPVRQGILEFWK